MTPHQIDARRHAAQDLLIADVYESLDSAGQWLGGCSIGCFAHDLGVEPTRAHAAVAEYWGVPEWVAHLADTIFEGLSEFGEHRAWHVQLADACAQVTDWPDALHRVQAAIRREAERAAGDVREMLEAQSIGSMARLAAWSVATGADCRCLRDAILSSLPTPQDGNPR